MSDILYIVIPAYNESQNIRQLINDWYPVIEKHNGNGKSRLIIIMMEVRMIPTIF